MLLFKNKMMSSTSAAHDISWFFRLILLQQNIIASQE